MPGVGEGSQGLVVQEPGDLSQATEACPGPSESTRHSARVYFGTVIIPLASLLPQAVMRSLLLCVVNTVIDPGSPGTFLPSQASQAA